MDNSSVSNSWKLNNEGIFSKLKYAIQGLDYGIKNDKSIKIAIYTGIIYSMLSILLCPTLMVKCAGVITIFFWLVIELINSSIETTIDRISLDKHVLSGAAKDLAAAASFISVIIIFIITIFLIINSYKNYKIWKKNNKDKNILDYIKYTFTIF